MEQGKQNRDGGVYWVSGCTFEKESQGFRGQRYPSLAVLEMPFKHKTKEGSPPAGLGRAKPAEDRPCKGPGAAVWAQESSVIGRNQVKARNGAEANVLEWAMPTRWGL